jgi:hypothetical protein
VALRRRRPFFMREDLSFSVHHSDARVAAVFPVFGVLLIAVPKRRYTTPN